MEKYLKISPVIRGMLIDLTGKPQCVRCEPAGDGIIPDGAMCVETNGVEIGAEESEKNITGIIRRAYDEWKKSAVNNATEGSVLIPSCAVLSINGKPEVLYWTGEDFDSASKRFKEKNAAPREEIFVKTASTGSVNIVEPADRALVVKNRVTLVTGGAQGIGEEIVRNLAAAGAFVFIADLNIDRAITFADELNDKLNRNCAFGVQVNVSDESSVEAMFTKVLHLTGGLDLCISNAGVLKAGSVLEQELSDFKFVTDINYTGFFVICKHAGRLMRTQHFAAPNWKTDIVQINSKSGLEGSNKNGAYAGGKFGGLGLVASFAMELIEYNIKVNAICPGNFLDGPLWSDPDKGLFVQYLKTGKVPGAKTIADVRSFYESKVPLKRGCTGKDIVRALYYIVEQEYETGQAVPVTGGQIMLH